MSTDDPGPSAPMAAMPPAERPRERLLRLGPEALSTAELVAIVLRTGRPGANSLAVGHQIVARYGLAGLARASAHELAEVPGCGAAKAAQLKAAVEIGRRLAYGVPESTRQIDSPSAAAEVLRADMALLEQEHLRVMLLNVKNHLLGVHEVYKGSVSASLVRVSEVFREAVRCNCPTIIVAHNHPSGDPAPSAEDVHVTRQIVEAGRLLDIDVLDHIIIGRQRWVSLRERGLGFS